MTGVRGRSEKLRQRQPERLGVETLWRGSGDVASGLQASLSEVCNPLKLVGAGLSVGDRADIDAHCACGSIADARCH